ncbi:hypothetical protein PHLCEN_2v6711 [Hermanssonia centrifuga]|uniref:S-adenosylmethionine-dependent methyltransferase n=1 Tax=Hermanssonia centrifuga TaxID=98765 RepID=A0A2R6NYM0_9APHY|nr:hypothetical protein PHLCEN_2v6711 [Hermanssonia centrifuga]
MARLSRPTPPTSSLPPLIRLANYSTTRIEQALQNVRAIYFSQALPRLPAPAKPHPTHLIHDSSVPDSGYASAEEDDELEEDEDNDIDLDILRSDAFEREFALRWLTAFTARSDSWVYDPDFPDEEDARAQLVDSAASLLASFAGDDKEEALTRTFSFPLCHTDGKENGPVEVELNDAALLSQDHTSVGLQSWGSCIILAEQMCAEPAAFTLSPGLKHLRILELGAGTGLLSIATAKILQAQQVSSEVIATDYHPSVLENLRGNVTTNFPSSSQTDAPVKVMALDWQNPVYQPPLHQPFDIILAADVIYHPEHAQWIKRCAETLLARPNPTDRNGGVFWLIIPVRSTGRHEGIGTTVEAVFPYAPQVHSSSFEVKSAVGSMSEMELAILSASKVGKHSGIGRADESGYSLFKIGWVRSMSQ